MEMIPIGALENPGAFRWMLRLAADARGHPLSSVGNAMLVMQEHPELAGALCFDRATQCLHWRTRPPWSRTAGARLVDIDHDPIQFARWAEATLSMHFPVGTARDAMSAVAREAEIDSLADWLSGLQWDGVERIDTWLTHYLQADNSALNQAFGRRWLIGAAARGLAKTDVKMDTTLVLEGAQGVGKSKALAILGGEWFTDSIPGLDNHKEAAISIIGKWIVELPELASMRRKEIEHVKAFLTATSDKVRLPYERNTTVCLRRCVFAGTTNEVDYLRDTENRRFWPVTVRGTDDAALHRDREQLLAEAVAAYRKGDQWWLRSDETELLANLKAAHVQRSPDYDLWTERVLAFLEGRTDAGLWEVAVKGLGLELGRLTVADKHRIADIMRGAGWSVKRNKHNNRWVPPAQEPA